MMSHTRFQQLLAGVPANARKVYEHVPVNEAWTYTVIHRELQSVGRQVMALNILQGCIRALREAGLVQEGPPGHFQRVPHKAPLLTLRDLRLVRNEPAQDAEPRPVQADLVLSPPQETPPVNTNIDTIRMAKALVEANGYVCLLKADFDKDQEAFVKLDDELKGLKDRYREAEAKNQILESELAELRRKPPQPSIEPVPVWKTIGYDFEADFKKLGPMETRSYKLPAGRSMSAMMQAACQGARRAMGETGWFDSVTQGNYLLVIRRAVRSDRRDEQSAKAAARKAA